MSKIGTNHILCILSPKNAEIEKPKNIRGLEIAKNDCIKYVYFRMRVIFTQNMQSIEEKVRWGRLGTVIEMLHI